jgi:cytochrome P450
MSDNQLRDEILTLILGGHETSGNALAWTWYLLSRNPEADARMREEIQALGGKPPGMEDLGRLSYTSWVFDEALRLYPQNWVMSRDTIEEDTLGGYAVPPRTTVFLGVYACHHGPEH